MDGPQNNNSNWKKAEKRVYTMKYFWYKILENTYWSVVTES